jgi:hypothetical protein
MEFASINLRLCYSIKKTFTLIRIKAGITFFYEEQCQERKYPAMMSRVTFSASVSEEKE